MDGMAVGTILRLCRRKYLYEPFRLCLPLNNSATEEGTKCRNTFSPMAAPWELTATREGRQPEGLQQNEYCNRKYLQEFRRLCPPLNNPATEEGTECRNRFSPMAAPWELTATREGKQPEGLQQNEYCSWKYLPESCRLCPPLNNPATEEGTECRNRFSPMAAPWESTAMREGKQPEGLQQNEYCNFDRFRTRLCSISTTVDKTMSPFQISISFTIFESALQK
jgi:hypothetical protein